MVHFHIFKIVQTLSWIVGKNHETNLKEYLSLTCSLVIKLVNSEQDSFQKDQSANTDQLTPQKVPLLVTR